MKGRCPADSKTTRTQPMNDSPTHLLGMNLDQLKQWVVSVGEKPFRAKQLAQWMYEKRELDPDQMTNLPAIFREKLKERAVFRTADVVTKRYDEHSDTTKIALRYRDGSIVETVLMLEPQGDDVRKTICVSTQAGCAMGCRFCASGLKGLRRHLTAGEILEQFYAVAEVLPDDQKITNVVYMGMGEPLHNWEEFYASLMALTADWGFAMSGRRITVSTVGLAKRIVQLADAPSPPHLAVSLHAPNDAVRDAVIPTNEAYGGIESIADAARAYIDATGRKLTFEYTLVRDLNDRPEHARELAELIASRIPGANVNLIPMNPVEGTGLKAPLTEDVEFFADHLTTQGLSAHTRKKKGRSINAACGQLRLEIEEGMSA